MTIANDSEIKYEYIDGEIVAMAGGTIVHGRLIGRAMTVLGRLLEGKPCVALPSDVRVRIRAADRATYPDLHVVCGEVEHDSEDDHAIVNPTVIVEVLSESTAQSDRTFKFFAYRRLKSLRDYVLVSQAERRVDIFRREGRRWAVDEYATGERFRLDSIEIEVGVDELYVDGLGVIVA
jgi:Uma2 family endonuclease